MLWYSLIVFPIMFNSIWMFVKLFKFRLRIFCFWHRQKRFINLNMSRSNLPKSLLDRELGQNSALSGFDQPVWSCLVSSRKDRQEFQFSNSSKIFSIQFKENYLVVLTKNSDCFVLNALEGSTWHRILNSNYQVFKAIILVNNCLFLVCKRVTHENLKFFIIQNPFQMNQPIQVLTEVHATLENLKDCDVYTNKSYR